MRWIQSMGENIKRGIRSWLNVQPTNPVNITINEVMDYESNAIKNRIWYRGDSTELQQLYQQLHTGVDKYKFWACQCSPGMEIRKIHTGLPALIVDTLTGVTLNDLTIKFEDQSVQELWEKIEQDNKLKKKLEKATKETLYIGDGAFKVSFDKDTSEYPIVEYYPGDRIELEANRGRIREVIFKTSYTHAKRHYVLYEHYGFGYITYELFRDNKKVDLYAIPQTKNLEAVQFGSKEDKYMLAIPIQIYESGKWDGRGQSIFDKKIDSFDALDEAWSQWMDALRAGRAKEYIPECLLPRDPNTGKIMAPNHFDNRYIKTDAAMNENAQNKIDVEQPDIPHDSYLATYVTALDLCLQGLISPSTLGIDMKKLDNAEAQREKEKTTLYTRDTIIEALQTDIKILAETIIRAHNELEGKKPTDNIEATVEFSSYANPSFESQVETVSKARSGQIMSVETAVDELYGDDRDTEWKEKEVSRIKEELGIAEVEEPGLNLDGILQGENEK